MTASSIKDRILGNLPGAVIGGVALYLGAKKVLKVENKWYVIVLVAAGMVAGAMVQSKIKSKAALSKATAKL